MKTDFSSLQYNYPRLVDIIIGLPFLVVPLFIDLPYRVNIFLSWEGAYRLYLGQVPFKDFGLPMGFGYWIIPAMFFKIFGPSFVTLVKSQVFINLLSLLSLRGILYHLKIKPLLVSLALLTFCLTYVIYNFWPWYNHSVIVFELISIYFLMSYLVNTHSTYRKLLLFTSAVFTFLAFFTKQDAGAICLMICLGLLTYEGITTRRYSPILFYLFSFVSITLLVIIPFLKYDFLYWFNYGQPPHNSRIGLMPLADVFFSGAEWEKIYLALFVILLIAGGRSKIASIFHDRNQALLSLITLGLLGQAIITRVSSPLPTNHMTYFHAFAVVWLISLTPLYFSIQRLGKLTFAGLIIVLSFSSGYWKYVKGILGVSISKEDASIPRLAEPWVESPFDGFEKVLMPEETVDGVKKLLNSQIVKKENLKVLNMSELTPLALEMDYKPPTDQPLWYHLNIGIFQKEVEELCRRVKDGEYDLVLFQDIPGLVHFYPYQVRDTLKAYYRLENSFLAPRKLENSVVEVYVRKERMPNPEMRYLGDDTVKREVSLSAR